MQAPLLLKAIFVYTKTTFRSLEALYHMQTKSQPIQVRFLKLEAYIFIPLILYMFKYFHYK